MDITAAPAATHAVIVGIDGYKEGASYDLNYSVDDALAFAQWLHDHGVPNANMRLLLSPREGRKVEQDEAARQFGNPIFPNAQAVLDCFENDLPSAASELLLVYWAGHGVMDNIQRNLMLADTVKDAKRTVQFEDLSNLLRTRYKNHRTQFLIVDACANSYADYRARTTLSSVLRSKEQDVVPNLVQLVAFAASNGQKASDGAGKTKAAFGRRFLREMGDPKRPGWPDFAGIFDKVRAEIKDDPDLRQTPVCYIYDDGAGHAGESNTFSQLGPSLAMEALALMQGMTLDYARLRRCYYRTAADRGTAPPAENLERMLRALHDMPLPVTGLPPLLAFAARVAAGADGADAAAAAELHAWVERNAASKVDLDQLKGDLAKEEAAENAAVWFLTVELGGAIGASELRPERAWLWDAAGKTVKQWPDDSGLTTRLELGVIIDQAEEMCDPANLVLELAVPMPDFGQDFAGTYVTIGADQLAAPRKRLGNEYGVVLRAKERQSGGGRSNTLARNWKKTAQILCDRWHGAGYRVAWLDGANTGDSIDNCLLNDKHSGLFGMRFMPPPLSADADHPLVGAVLKGVPFMFWVTPEPDSWDGAVARLDALCAAANGPGLFLELRKLRANVNDTHHLGAKLKVLWDDPARNPTMQFKQPT